MPKWDGAGHFFVDFHRENAASKFHASPVPHADKLLDQLYMPHFYSTLTLTKGHCQNVINQSPWRNFSSFWFTAICHLHFRGLLGEWTKCYSIFYCNDCHWHMYYVRAKPLRWIELMPSFQLAKWWYVVWTSTLVMGKCIPNFITVIVAWMQTKTKKVVREFLELVGYYHSIIHVGLWLIIKNSKV